jgi:broad specificity phosphatase PhoE
MAKPITITLLRHSTADKSLPNHRLHPLSEAGVHKALERQAQLNWHAFDLILTSELIRTKETARLIGHSHGTGPTVTVPELFPAEEDPRGQVVDKVFAELGHTSLAKYYEKAAEEMKSLASDAGIAITKQILEHDAWDILIVGHGMLLQAIGIALTTKDEPFMTQVVGECQGFRITLQDGPEPRIEFIN